MSKGKILVVEPDERVKQVLDMYFGEQLGYELHYINYSSIQIFHHVFETFKPDLILNAYEDINLNESKTWGIDKATHEIITLSHKNNISIIFLVNQDRRYDWSAEHIGWQPDYVVKPFDIEHLAQRVSMTIEMRRKHESYMKEQNTEPDD